MRDSSMVRRDRRGFTIAEMIVAMTLLLVIVGATIPFFRAQARALDRSAGRLDAQQNARFGVNAIDRDLRVAGLGVVDAQPIIVYAGARVLAFNADLATGVKNDASAVYYNADLSGQVLSSIGSARRIAIPTTSFTYPDTTYRQGGGGPASAAETIMFWVSPDSTSGRSDEYLLWRQVNDAPPSMLAAGIRLQPGEGVFSYTKTDSGGRPVPVAPAALPYYHMAPMHSISTGTRPDTGVSARTDSIRAVSIRLVGRFRDPRGNDVLDTVATSVRILNAGLNKFVSCGERPLFTGAPQAVVNALPGGAYSVTISWQPSIDENSGEKDVERYALYRKRAADPVFDDEPIVIIPADARTGPYGFTDTDVASGDQWQYATDAQDCSPQSSDLAKSPVLTFP